MEECSKVGEKGTQNSHQHTNTPRQIAIGTQLACQADQERSKELQHGTSVNHSCVELLFTVSSHHKANMSPLAQRELTLHCTSYKLPSAKITPKSGDRCDRILWYGKGVRQLSYFRSESKFSDHRPVSALFSIPIEVMKVTNPRKVFPTGTFLPMPSGKLVSSGCVV